MPIALVFIGVLLLVAAIRDRLGALGTLVSGDFTGQGNFFYWSASLIILGALGYSKVFRTPSRALIGLVLLVMILSNKGFFAQLQSAVANVQAPAPSGQTAPQSAVTAPAAASGAAASGSGILGKLAGLGKAVSTLTSVMGVFGL
jgi:hypothetical protein